eukprot:g18215.t1
MIPLTLNNFSFNSSHFLQVRRVAVYTRVGPSYACLFVGYMERCLFQSYSSPHPQPFLQYNFNQGASKMSTFFLNRGFPSSVVDRAFNWVQPISHTSVLTPSLPSHNSDRVTLTLTYHPTSSHIQKIIRCHFRHLQRDATSRHLLPSQPLSAFSRDHSLWDTLVQTSFTPNTFPQPHGTFPCNQRRCNTCPFTSSLPS